MICCQMCGVGCGTLVQLMAKEHSVIRKKAVYHLMLTNSHRWFPPPVKPNLHPWLINSRGDVFQPEHYMNNYTEGRLNVFATIPSG